jgi:hypothetical protein
LENIQKERDLKAKQQAYDRRQMMVDVDQQRDEAKEE